MVLVSTALLTIHEIDKPIPYSRDRPRCKPDANSSLLLILLSSQYHITKLFYNL